MMIAYGSDALLPPPCVMQNASQNYRHPAGIDSARILTTMQFFSPSGCFFGPSG